MLHSLHVVSSLTHHENTAPEASDNPLGYKFSWSSRGVLLALRNDAKYYKDGRAVSVAGTELMGTAKAIFIYPAFAFVGYPNRDSTPFRERYSIPEAQELLRGTLRYQGFPEFVRVLVDIGFLNSDPRDFLAPDTKQPISWAECTQKVLRGTSPKESDLHWAIASKTQFTSNQEKDRILAGMAWLGMFSSDPVTPRGNPLDTLCATLEQKMAYRPGERDMVMLQHKFGIEWPDGRKETRTSTLCDYGDPDGYSSMAKLVGVPCGVATRMVLEGKIAQKGILAPVTWELAEPLLKEINRLGIRMVEKTLP